MSRAILVTGATGKQGGAVVNALLKCGADFRILALTRDPASPSAQRLAAKSKNISLVQGNLNEPDAIFPNAKKVEPSIWGVFSVQVGLVFPLNPPPSLTSITRSQGSARMALLSRKNREKRLLMPP